MAELDNIHTAVNAERSTVASGSLLIDWIAISLQSLVDKKAKLEDFQEFALALHNNRQSLAQAIARNTPAESSGAAEAVPAAAIVTDEAPEPVIPIEDIPPKGVERPKAKSAVKAVGAGYVMGKRAGKK
jgi:hypothetical protein